MIERNRVEMGGVYLQISRGQAPDRDFAYPAEGVAPTVVLFTQEKTGVADQAARDSGLKVITIEDQRWGRCDIKTVQLLYPSMAKMMAQASGAQDAWLTRGGEVTEGTANNAYIVKNGVIITRNLGNDILPGVTRRAVLRMAEEHGLAVEERAFTVEEAYAADEAFATASVLLVKPVVEIDGNKIGQGSPGPVTCALRATCIDEALRATIG